MDEIPEGLEVDNKHQAQLQGIAQVGSGLEEKIESAEKEHLLQRGNVAGIASFALKIDKRIKEFHEHLSSGNLLEGDSKKNIPGFNKEDPEKSIASMILYWINLLSQDCIDSTKENRLLEKEKQGFMRGLQESRDFAKVKHKNIIGMIQRWKNTAESDAPENDESALSAEEMKEVEEARRRNNEKGAKNGVRVVNSDQSPGEQLPAIPVEAIAKLDKATEPKKRRTRRKGVVRKRSATGVRTKA